MNPLIDSRFLPTAAAVLLLPALSASTARAHCEIPCGIYGDQMRVDQLKEHFHTVEKSMKQIKELSADPGANANQLVRWVMNKDDHANEIQHIVYHYFMNQRVKPVDSEKDDSYETYSAQVILLHRMLVQAMKCKQSTDEVHVEKLRSYLAAFEQLYFEAAEHEHQ